MLQSIFVWISQKTDSETESQSRNGNLNIVCSREAEKDVMYQDGS